MTALRTVSNTVTWQVLQAFSTTSSGYENKKSFYWHNPAEKSSSPEVRLIFTPFVKSTILSATKITVDFISEEDLTSGLIQLNAWSSHKNVMVGHFHLVSMIHSFQGSWHTKTFVGHTWVTDTAHRDFLHKESIYHSYMCTDAKCQQKGFPGAFTANNPISFRQLFP